MNNERTYIDELPAAITPLGGHAVSAKGMLPCHWRRVGPFGMRVIVRPGPRSRVVHRVLRKNDRAGFFRAMTHA